MDYTRLSRNELISICKENKIKGYSNKKKEHLIELLINISTTPIINKTTPKLKIKKEAIKNKTIKFSKLSIEITKSLSIIDKKSNGIYFTPPQIVKETLQTIICHLPAKNIKKILEPSCGSCEFITQINDLYKDINITGIEFNKQIYDTITTHKLTIAPNNNLTLINEDYLKYSTNVKYDLIIGNPPYFVMPKSDVDKKYFKYFDGRPNIFVLFIVKSLELLEKNGILAFVLPNNFLNSMYYNKIREYINTNFTIIDIKNHAQETYLETQQDTCVIILQNITPSTENTKYTYNIHNGLIFNTKEQINIIHNLYKDSVSLDSLGFDVKVGSIVWNENKDILTDDDTNTLLIYSSDITDNTLNIKKYSNEEKKNYIQKDGSTDLSLVINRGYGKGKYQFSYLLIDLPNKPYLVENHLICVKSRNKISKTTLKNNYNKIIQSFNDKRTTEFIELYFGNNAISTTELQFILPIYGF